LNVITASSRSIYLVSQCFISCRFFISQFIWRITSRKIVCCGADVRKKFISNYFPTCVIDNNSTIIYRNRSHRAIRKIARNENAHQRSRPENSRKRRGNRTKVRSILFSISRRQNRRRHGTCSITTAYLRARCTIR